MDSCLLGMFSACQPEIAMGELIGAEGNPVARLTLLGWTCVSPAIPDSGQEPEQLFLANRSAAAHCWLTHQPPADAELIELVWKF